MISVQDVGAVCMDVMVMDTGMSTPMCHQVLTITQHTKMHCHAYE